MFSRLARSISRSRNYNLSCGNGGRSQISTDSSFYQSRYIRQADDNIGVVLKRYLGSLAPSDNKNGSRLSSDVFILDTNPVLSNARIRRLSSEAQKLKSEFGFPYDVEESITRKDDMVVCNINIKPYPQVISATILAGIVFFSLLYLCLLEQNKQIRMLKIAHPRQKGEENSEAEEGKEEHGL